MFLSAWLIASESEARTYSRQNSRQPRSSLSQSVADYAPILRKTSSLSSQDSLNSYHDQDSPAPDRRGDIPPLTPPVIEEVPENGLSGSQNNNVLTDSLPLKTYGTTANHTNET